MLVFLTGFMGCGKSTVGRFLAKQLGCAFIDSDEQIEAAVGMTIRELFEKQGEAAFRDLERRFVQKLDAGINAVVSLGGGLPCHHDLMDALKELGTVIYLETSPVTLASRLEGERFQRPLLSELSDLTLFIETKLGERSSCYQQAHYIVKTDKKSVEQLVNACIELLG